MTGNENGFSLLRAERDFGGDGMAVSAGVAGIEYLHGPEIDLAALEYNPDPVGKTDIGPGHGRESLAHVCIDGIVRFSEDLRMIRVGGDALQSKKGDVLERLNIGVHKNVRHPLHD